MKLYNPSLQIINGNPAVSYYDITNNIKFIRSNTTTGSVWGTPITIDSLGSVGQYTSLQVVDGNPAISYSNLSTGDLKFARFALTPVEINYTAMNPQ